MAEIIAAAAAGQTFGPGTITCDVVTNAVGTWDAAAGDTLVAIHSVEWGFGSVMVPDPGTDPGWTFLDEFDHSGGTAADGLHVRFWALESWDGTTTAFTFDHSADADTTLVIVAVRGVDLAGFVADATYTATGTAERAAPSVAGAADGVLLAGATSGSDVTGWASDDMPELADVRPSVFVSSVVAGEVLTADGATNERGFTATGTGATEDAIAWSLMLPPTAPPTTPPGTPSVGASDLGADTNVAPPAPADAGARQFALVSFTVDSETWSAGQGPADTGWTLRASLNLTTPNSNSPDRGNTARVELWEQNTPSTAAVSWTKSGTRRYGAVRISWPGVGGTPTFTTPVQSSNSTTHVTPPSTPPANVACKVVAISIVDQGPTPVTLTSPGAPWSEVAALDLPSPLVSETQSIRVVEQAFEATGSPAAVSATFTTSAVEEAFLVSFVLPGGEDGGGTPSDEAAVRYGWGAPHSISDDFDGSWYATSTAPDPAKWDNAPEEGMPGHDQNGRRIASCTTVTGGVMTMRGLPNGDTGWCKQKLDTTYGRWEVRSRSRNIGTTGELYHILHLIWPTLEDWPMYGEYDFMEYEDPDGALHPVGGWLHYPHPADQPVQQERWEDPAIDPTQWHNYALEWTETGLTIYVDGELKDSFSGGAIAGVRDDIQSMPGGHLIHQVDNFTGPGGLREAVLEIEWSRFYALEGATPVAPTVSAGADVAAHPVGAQFTRTAAESDGGSAITSRLWTINAGPTGAGSTIGTTAALSWTPTVTGTYTLRYTATNAVGTSTPDDMQITVVAAGGGGVPARTRGFLTLL